MGPVCFSLPFHGFSAPLLMNSFTAQLLRQPRAMLPGAARCRESRSRTQTAASKESSLVLGPFGANWGKKAARGGYGSPGAAGWLAEVRGGSRRSFRAGTLRDAAPFFQILLTPFPAPSCFVPLAPLPPSPHLGRIWPPAGARDVTGVAPSQPQNLRGFAPATSSVI